MNSEMEYTERRFPKPIVLAEGEYEGFGYIVLSLGTHPCAYVNVGHTSLNGLHYDEVEKLGDTGAHGGLTYSNRKVHGTDVEGWWLGWDYSHYGDRYGAGDMYLPGDSYTTAEIEFQCRDVIDNLGKLVLKAGNGGRK